MLSRQKYLTARRRSMVVAVASAISAGAAYAQEPESQEQVLEEVFVVGKAQAYSSNMVSEDMKLQESPITSVNGLVNNLPGVSVQEGDTYGFDDWSTTVSLRGFQTNLDEQQVGTTLDGMPNGGSNYGGGAKANRYVDSANLGGVEVSQGTADIASRSLEALGGTLAFQTDDPLEDPRARIQVSGGEHDAKRYYGRYDTGVLFGNTRAWMSASHQEASDWIDGSAENKRDHFAGKLISEFDRATVTAYLSYDDTHEDNYQRLWSEQQYDENSDTDGLIGHWTGVPYVDQVYRQGWSTLRKNWFGYTKLDWAATDNLNINSAVYYHDNKGRGDWIPPYLRDVTDDGDGPQSEYTGGTTYYGDERIGYIFFVDPAGNALSPTEGCVSSITFPYGGGAAYYDPACYPAGSIPVQSYRHTHYKKKRAGLTMDADWTINIAGLENTVRGGIWYEDGKRTEARDWHKLVDARVGIDFNDTAYWREYDRDYPQTIFNWYLQDSVVISDFTFTAGIKKYAIDLERKNNMGQSDHVSIDSDSDVLFSGGVVWQTPLDGLEAFAGYAENFKSLSDNILERPDSDLNGLDPETADNYEAGLRYRGDLFNVTATYFDSTFDNRIIFLGPESAAGPNYDIGTSGSFFNAGGIDSSGFELAFDMGLTDEWSVYSAYTYIDATYKGTGDKDVDATIGITNGNTVIGIPENQLVLALNWARGNIESGLTAKYTGDRYVDYNNSWQADGYTTVDFNLMLHGGPLMDQVQGWSVNFLINNLTDENYLGGISGGGAWLGAPRTASVTFTLDI